MIICNKIRCKKCGTILESKSVHDFQSCPCGTFTDGGKEYIRWGGVSLDDIEDLCEFSELPTPKVSHLGIILDQSSSG